MKPCIEEKCHLYDEKKKLNCSYECIEEMELCAIYEPEKESSELSRSIVHTNPKPTGPEPTSRNKSWKPSRSSLDIQVGGDHYKNMAIQPIEFTMKNNLNFCQGNIVKYATRYKFKNGIEDLKKAKHYVDLLIDLEYGGEQE